jgi:hypothetical protein
MKASINPRLSALRQSVQESQKKLALRFLMLTIFVLTTFPLLSYKVASVPIYAIDILIFLTWVYAQRLGSDRRKLPLQGYVTFILIAAVLSEFIASLSLGTLLQPLYIIVRTALAVSLFFSTPKIIQTKSDLEAILKAALIGSTVNAFLMIASSLPQTQGIIASYVFRWSFLIPSADNIALQYGNADAAMRGQSLLGVSILSAAFLNTFYPMVFVLRDNQKLSILWKRLINAAMFLIPLGVVLSYSRGAIMGLVMIVGVVLALNSGKVRQPVLIGVAASILLFSWVGWGSEYFKFEWLQTKNSYQLARFDTNTYITQRTNAYTDPFLVIRDHPSFIFLGEGFARDKVGAPSVASQYAVHAVFGAAAYGYGLLAAFAYMLLLFNGLRIAWRYAWNSAKDQFIYVFSRAMLASLFGFSSWFFLGHAVVDEPRGAQLLFFIFGLVASLPNIAPKTEPVEEKTPFVVKRLPARGNVSTNALRGIAKEHKG